MAEIDRGMDVADMKRLLVKSKTEPVNVAVALNGKDAVMLLNKIKQPKAVSKDLEGKYKEAKNTRWGTAFVDIDADPKLVVLTLNRAASGLGQKLRKTLKGTGFSKIRIQLEDGSVAEDIGEEDEEEEGEGGTQARAPAEEPAPPAAASAGQEAPEQDAASGDAEDQAPAFDPKKLTQRLAGLVKQMLSGPPDRQSALKDLATKAQAAIKSGDESAATQAVDTLERALQAGGPADAVNGGGATAAVLAKSRIAWVSARKRVEDEIGKLHDAMSKHYEGHGFGADLDQVFTAKVQPILSSLDQSLASKLDEVGQNTDPAQHQKLVGEARQIIDRYESFIASDSLIPQLDSNPFVPLTIQKTLTATLEALKKSVR